MEAVGRREVRRLQKIVNDTVLKRLEFLELDLERIMIQRILRTLKGRGRRL